MVVDLLSNIESPVDEKTLVMHAINGIGEKYEQVAGIILHKKKRPTIFGPAASFSDVIAQGSLPISTTHHLYSISSTFHQSLHVAPKTWSSSEETLYQKKDSIISEMMYDTLSRYKEQLVANDNSEQQGALQYLTFTRPVLSYAIQQLCLYMHDPWKPHMNALKHVLRYARGTMDLGLQLYQSSTSQLITYSDADWAWFPVTRRSTFGNCVFLRDNLLSWSSKRQHTLSRSSAEFEYRGVANAVAETA
ncbi:ribonuclease H-like domain-containing protein [Tanacetum coccineum]